jgi:glycosyltransferase involved in cell wall biosynthesis
VDQIRLLFVTRGLDGGGIERIMFNLIDELDPARFHSTVFLHTRPTPNAMKAPASCELIWSQELGYPPAKLPAIFADFVRAARRADVIIAAHVLHPTLIAYLGARLLRKPVIGWVHFDWMRIQDCLPDGRTAAALRRIYPRMDRVISCSVSAEESLRGLIPSVGSVLSTIPNFASASAVEARLSEPVPAWAEAVLREPTVIGAGRLAQEKGFDLLIAAHAHLRARGARHHLLIVGAGPEEARLRAQIRDLGVGDTVFLPGHVDNPYPLMKRATVFALSSRHEGFGMVLLEAMHCGTPLVAAGCRSGPREVLADGACGVLVPEDDSVALADGIGRLLADPALRARLAQSAREHVRRYSPEVIVPRWEALFTELAGRSVPRASLAGS